MIYLFVPPPTGARLPLVFGYQNYWPELRRLIWDPANHYPEDDEICADCGCFRWYCGGPGRYDDPAAPTTCGCWDDELGEPTC